MKKYQVKSAGNEWPRISIVTPSLNQGDFIETTIQSVLSQEYPNLDYKIFDGGSTDNTLSILDKYDGQLTWISKKDKGQSDAINKGMQLATGEILAYVNADDILLPGSLFEVASIFKKRPEIKWVTGQCKNIDKEGKDIRRAIYLYKNILLYLSSFYLLLMIDYISQPATFWRKELIDSCGIFNTDLHYVMDYDFWLRIWRVASPYVYHKDLAGFRIHRNSKTTTGAHLQDFVVEDNFVVKQHSPSNIWIQFHNLHRTLMTTIYRYLNR